MRPVLKRNPISQRVPHQPEESEKRQLRLCDDLVRAKLQIPGVSQTMEIKSKGYSCEHQEAKDAYYFIFEMVVGQTEGEY